MKAEEDAERRDTIKSAITRLKQQIKSYDESEKKQAFDQNVKSRVMADAKQGKRPQFVNKCELVFVNIEHNIKDLNL